MNSIMIMYHGIILCVNNKHKGLNKIYNIPSYNMNIVLVCIGNFQEYILENIYQLIKLKHDSIYVITNEEYFNRFNEYKINLISCESLNDVYQYHAKTHMDKDFRNGFWTLTSSRFFYIYAFMEKYKIINVVHLENDVPVYYNCNILLNKLEKTKMYIPFDSYNRTIASIVYIPNYIVLGNILNKYDFHKNDMENFAYIKKLLPHLINHFPICIPNIKFSQEQHYVCKNFDVFNSIFDAAAIGQYLGGVDPRNFHGDSTGFINETCVVKYNNYTFTWLDEDNDNVKIKRPFIVIDGNTIPIFNLHIHSKNLQKFI